MNQRIATTYHQDSWSTTKPLSFLAKINSLEYEIHKNNIFISALEHYDSWSTTKPLENLAKTNEMTPTTRPQLGTLFRDTGPEEEHWPQIALATKRFRAIDLSCRACEACGAGCWVLGLDSRWGLRSAPFSPPTSDSQPQAKNVYIRKGACKKTLHGVDGDTE